MNKLKILFQYFATDQAIADHYGDAEALKRSILKDQVSRVLDFNTKEEKKAYIKGLNLTVKTDSETIEFASEEENDQYHRAISDMTIYNKFQILETEAHINGKRFVHSPDESVKVIFNNLSGKNFDINKNTYKEDEHQKYLVMMEHDFNQVFKGKLEYYENGDLISTIELS
jgi:hypothetical protein